MRTLDELAQYESKCFDRRDVRRLAVFLPADKLPELGLKPVDDGSMWEQVPLTREDVLERFHEDFDFGVEKAAGERGISASLMAIVMEMWVWVLGDSLDSEADDSPYGIDTYEEVAAKYGFQMKYDLENLEY